MGLGVNSAGSSGIESSVKMNTDVLAKSNSTDRFKDFRLLDVFKGEIIGYQKDSKKQLKNRIEKLKWNILTYPEPCAEAVSFNIPKPENSFLTSVT